MVTIVLKLAKMAANWLHFPLSLPQMENFQRLFISMSETKDATVDAVATGLLEKEPDRFLGNYRIIQTKR